MKIIRIFFLVALCASSNSYSMDSADEYQTPKRVLNILAGYGFGSGLATSTRFLLSHARVDDSFRASIAITALSTVAGATMACLLDEKIEGHLTASDINISHGLIGAGLAMMTVPFATRAIVDNNRPFDEIQDIFMPVMGAALVCTVLGTRLMSKKTNKDEILRL